MAHILQNIAPEFIPVFRTEIIEPDFDDAELELLELASCCCHQQDDREAA